MEPVSTKSKRGGDVTERNMQVLFPQCTPKEKVLAPCPGGEGAFAPPNLLCHTNTASAHWNRFVRGGPVSWQTARQRNGIEVGFEERCGRPRPSWL
eukprot:3918219-Rhodomonas_salina.1